MQALKSFKILFLILLAKCKLSKLKTVKCKENYNKVSCNDEYINKTVTFKIINRRKEMVHTLAVNMKKMCLCVLFFFSLI